MRDHDDHEERLTARMIGAEALTLVIVGLLSAVLLMSGAIVERCGQIGAAIFASEDAAQ